MLVLVATASPPLVKQYRTLLKSNWSNDTIQDLLTLLWHTMQSASQNIPSDWLPILDPESILVTAERPNLKFVERLRDFASFVRDKEMPPIPTGFSPARDERLAIMTERAWVYLTLHTHADIQGETGFFQDCQSMLFICSVDYWLPVLKKHDLPDYHDCLVNALNLHNFSIWRSQPAHQWYLQSLLMDYLGKFAERYEMLRRSLWLTPMNDHSYLTKAQALWSDLVDVGMYAEAETFLLSLYRYSRTGQLDEIRDMLHSMYESYFANHK